MTMNEPGWQHGVSVPPPLGLDEGWFNIGLGVLVRWVGDGQGNRCGLIEAHRNGEGDWCAGFVAWDVPCLPESIRNDPDRHLWQVESVEPLTLSPSISCPRCGHHGFIQQGQWVAA